MTVKHATFTLERVYPVSPERVFAAWSDPAAKAGWFTVPGGRHSLDFRVGGREVTSGPPDDGKDMVFDARYEDIAENERIVYSGTLSAKDVLATVSVTTVLLEAEGDGTRLTLIEQGTFLDGHEEPSWREQGTGTWLDNLGKVFSAV
ncbi:SRPBCC family protein [Amycolatopsis azurea]|uniref:SRPBCC family protein n=1 Tax=Amycolatopsis azurea TaxID=36819 RepID=UPI00381FEA26